MVIEFGVYEFNYNMATPFKENGNNRNIIASFETWCCL